MQTRRRLAGAGALSSIVITLACVVIGCSAMASQETVNPPGRPADLVNLGLEDLMKIEVTSVSKRPEKLLDAAASIYVITAEEIRRSGVTSLPEALRLAPNLEVGQASASGYAISSRGFNNTSANKLLVLIDGRTVYSPLFSGVFWDAQDVMLEDIDRIEVISGPGGTLWGVNAVNGVINVITRAAKETQGLLVAAGAGNRENDTALRYGAAVGGDGNYRVFGKYFDRDHTSTALGTPKTDAWHQAHVGFRADWGRFTVLGDAYKGRNGQPQPGSISIGGVNLPLGSIPISGINVIGRWRHVSETGSAITVQTYYDRTERTVPPTFADKLQLLYLELEHSIRPIGRHSITWGGEYRYGMDRLVNSKYFAFLPAKLNQKWTSLFAQDEIALRKELRFTLGGRIERNDYTGSEFLPNARLAWRAGANHLLWTAASRTVRAPSRLDRDAFIPGSPPFLLRGGPDVTSEIATVYEIGYRGQYATAITYSATVFHAGYEDLRTQEINAARTFFFFGNGMKGTASGLETWASYQPSRVWRLSGGFSGLRQNFRLLRGSVDATAPAAQRGRDPERSWRLRSSLDLPYHTEFDLIARYVSDLPAFAVPGYTAVDARFGWRLGRGMEVSLTGQNLFDGGHGEFTARLTRTQFGRAVFLKIVTRFDRHD